MKKLKVYFDTSVINFLFADDAPEFKQITEELFSSYLIEYHIYISEIVLLEINKTSDILKKSKLIKTVSDYNLEIYETLNNDIEELAKLYIKEQAIPQKKLLDALHIAFCTYFEFDILLSWNFKHLANIKKQMAINSINEKNGYSKKLLLLNPIELIYEK